MVAAGSLHGLALKPNGTLWGWGGIPRHSFGKGGPTPRQMGSRQDWIFIWAAQDNGAGLTADGKLWLWGACLGEEPTLPVMDQVARAMGDLLRSHGVNSAWGRSQRLDYRHSSIPWCVLEFTNLPPGKLMGARFAPETLVDEK